MELQLVLEPCEKLQQSLPESLQIVILADNGQSSNWTAACPKSQHTKHRRNIRTVSKLRVNTRKNTSKSARKYGGVSRMVVSEPPLPAIVIDRGCTSSQARSVDVA